MDIFPAQQSVYKNLKTILGIHNRTNGAIRPHAHLTGPSGTGKTYLLKNLVDEMGMALIEVNAAGITAEGLSGNSLSKAMRPLREKWQNNVVVFVDEFDKLFERNGEQTEGFRSAVQDEFLTMLESDTTSIFTDYGKYEPFPVNRCLFIFGGAYSGKEVRTMEQLREAGLRNEFVGRVPLVFYTEPVPLQQLVQALPKMALFESYLEATGSKQVTTHVKKIAQMIQEQNKGSNIGIRLLNSTIHQYFISLITNEKANILKNEAEAVTLDFLKG